MKWWITILCIGLMITFNATSAKTEDFKKAGEVWQSVGGIGQAFYLRGFQNGASWAFTAMAGESGSDIPESKMKDARDKIEIDVDLTTLRKVISDFYDDPSNNLISCDELIFIARDKIKGEEESSINARLERARRLAIEWAKDKEDNK